MTGGAVRFGFLLRLDAAALALVTSGCLASWDPVWLVVDRDGDGFDSRVDCDDANASVNPGAAEQCADEIDNDCDGTTDLGALVGDRSWVGLQEAIDAAADGDTVTICSGSYAETIRVDKSLIVVGDGTERPVLSGGVEPLLEVSLPGGGGIVSIRGLTLLGAQNHGVAVTASSGWTVVLDDLLVAGNSRSGINIRGVSGTETVTVRSSMVSNNSDTLWAGGLDIEGDALIEDTTIERNTSTDGPGGMSIVDGMVRLLGANAIEANDSRTGAGGLSIDGYLVGPTGALIDGATVSGNTSELGTGGVSIRLATVDLIRSDVLENTGGTTDPTGGIHCFAGCALEVQAVDFGTSSTDNSPNDIRAGGQEYFYDDNTSASCTETACAP